MRATGRMAGDSRVGGQMGDIFIRGVKSYKGGVFIKPVV